MIASCRFPVAEPFAGGLEAHVWHLSRRLRRRGHEVSLFAGPGSDPELRADLLPVGRYRPSASARADVSMPPLQAMEEHHAYLSLMIELIERGYGRYDLVHNHSLHHLPLAMAAALPVPLVSTLHTPPTPWLESALQILPRGLVHLAAVSEHTARAWRHVTGPIEVVPNGVDLDVWRPGPGGGPLVWSGRLVPEKGPDLAIAAARRAGRPLDLIGPVIDAGFFAAAVAPHLGVDVRYLGHLSQHELAAVVGAASAALVTPRWDEPYGLVVAEALACGTPVVALARGGIPEILTPACGVLVDGEDIAGLAAAIPRAIGLSRVAARRRAERACSLELMVDRYEDLYDAVLRRPTAARAS